MPSVSTGRLFSPKFSVNLRCCVPFVSHSKRCRAKEMPEKTLPSSWRADEGTSFMTTFPPQHLSVGKGVTGHRGAGVGL